MSGSEDEWEDLVRRLEATESGVSEEGPQAGRDQDQGPLPDDAGHGPGHASPQSPGGSTPPGPAASGGSGSSGSSGNAGNASSSGPFSFKVDPASGFHHPGAASHSGVGDGRPGGITPRGPRDSDEPDDDPFVTDFVPPEAEPLLVGRPDRVIAWIIATGMPLLLLVLLIFARNAVPPLLWPVMLVSTLAAWVYLVWKLPVDREEDGDNGARI